MNTLSSVFAIARVEARLLFRSWGFRIFAGTSLVLLVLVMVALTLSPYQGLYISRALSGAFPLVVIKLLNVFQGIMAVFVAAEFLNRDRKLDTTEVIYAHPFANGAYILGKFLGIFAVFAALDAAIVLIAAVIHVFFSQQLFSAAAYLSYLLLLVVPTLVFMTGLTMLLGSLIRIPAIVTLVTLAYVFFSLVIFGPRFSFAFDGFGFHAPIFYSDFIGLGNLSALLPLRAAYALLGLSFVLGAILLMNRLPQASRLNKALGLVVFLGAVSASLVFAAYLQGIGAARRLRAEMKTESRAAAGRPTMAIETCDLRLKPEGHSLSAAADLVLVNPNEEVVRTIILTLNPGLEITSLESESAGLSFRRTHHLVEIDAPGPIPPGGTIKLRLAYAGTIDERYCYLDLDEAKLATPLKFWLLSIPKRFAVVGPEFVHLTPESGWYPRSGLPQALLFPATARQDYVRFGLSVEAPAGLTAVSQGLPTIEESGSRKTFVFRPTTPLPQISLTLGRYENKSIDADGVRYSLYILNGHDRFTPKLAEIGAELPQIIKQLRDNYEVGLGLSYPYEQFALVEVPVQVTSHARLWTTAQELVQPQIVFLPEMGVFNSGAEFRMGGRMIGGGPGGGGQGQRAAPARGGPQASPKDIQRGLFNRFVQANLTGGQPGALNFRQTGPLGLQFRSNSEASFNIYPNFLAFTSRLGIAAWPLLDHALEAYLREKVAGQQAGPAMRLVQGLLAGGASQEAINEFLLDHSLAEALQSLGQANVPLGAVLEEKGKYLFTFIRASLGAPDFDERLIGFLKDRRFRRITRKDFEDFIAGLGRLDLPKTIATWYQEKGLPGFLIENVQSYRVIEGEKTKFQVKFQVSNPTDRQGVIKINLVTRGGFAARGGGGGMMGGPAAPSESRTVIVPAMTVKDVGIVLDQAAVMTTIDTTMSRNLPPVFNLPFGNQPPPPGVKPFDGETARPFLPLPPGANGEYIVDNEDKEFKLPEKGRENWLRRSVRRIFATEEAGQDPIAVMGLANPPDEWQPVILQNFYGRFVRSALVKKSGSGANKVAWTVNLAEPGNYDIFFYFEGIGGGPGRGPGMMGMRGQRGGQAGGGERPSGAAGGGQPRGQDPFAQRMRPGTKHFLVHAEDGVEEVVIDLKDARPGWTLIGKFRLPAGESLVELTDKNEARFVLADAIKWVVAER